MRLMCLFLEHTEPETPRKRRTMPKRPSDMAGVNYAACCVSPTPALIPDQRQHSSTPTYPWRQWWQAVNGSFGTDKPEPGVKHHNPPHCRVAVEMAQAIFDESPSSCDLDDDSYHSDYSFPIDLPPDIDVSAGGVSAAPGCQSGAENEAHSIDSSEPEEDLPDGTTEDHRREHAEMIQRLERALLQRQILRVEILGDGNCLFRAIALFVYGSPDAHGRVRHELMNHLEAHAESLHTGFDALGATAAEYIARTRCDAQWGGYLEMVVAEEVYNRAIFYFDEDAFAHSADGALPEIPVSTGGIPPTFLNPAGPVQRIRLIQSQRRGHFDAAVMIGVPLPLGIGLCHDPATGGPLRIDVARGRPAVDPTGITGGVRQLQPAAPTTKQSPGVKPGPAARTQQPRQKRPRLEEPTSRDADNANAQSSMAVHPNSLFSLHHVKSVMESVLTSPILTEYPLLPDVLRKGILGMNAIISRDGMHCFGVGGTVRELQSLQEALRSDAKTAKWRTVIEQCEATPPKLVASNQCRGHLATLNVHGLANKRQELLLLMESENIIALALQETRRNNTKLASVWPGHQLHETLAGDKPGEVGVGILVSTRYTSHIIGNLSRFHVSIQIKGAQLPQPFIVMSVYIPCPGPSSQRLAAIEIVVKAVQQLQATHPATPIVAMGDFNSSTAEVTDLVEGLGLKLAIVSGDNRTRHTANNIHRDIDHILTWNADWLPTARVDRSWPNGDHWPVLAEVMLSKVRHNERDKRDPKQQGRTKPQPRFAPSDQWAATQNEDVTGALFRKARPDIKMDVDIDTIATRQVRLAVGLAHHPRFSQVLDDGRGGERLAPTTQAQADKMVNILHEAIWQAGSDCGITAEYPQALSAHDPAARRTPSIALRTAIEQKRAAYRNLQQCPAASPDRDALKARFVESAKEAARIQSSENSARWTAFIDRTMAAVRRGTRLSWATIHRLKAPRAATTTTWQAMQDERGCLQSEPTVIKRLWEGYVRKLFSFNNGLSDEHWQNQAPALEPQGTAAEPPVDAAPNVTSITWPLCLQALRKLGNNKAPGPDGIPGEVLKLLLIAEPRCSEQPTTPMGRALWFTYQSTWTSCIIPAQWRESIIVFLQKKNTDATVFTGY
jgi:hypothetical protein